MRLRTCCFTGHRKINRTEIPALIVNLDLEIRRAVEQGVNTFVCGGAIGFDLIAANLVLCLKEKGQAVKLGLILPCKDQDRNWPPRERECYQYVLSHADEIQYVAEDYFDGCMKLRNQQMVARSDLCIAYLRNPRSGTAQTVRMAVNEGIPVVKL